MCVLLQEKGLLARSPVCFSTFASTLGEKKESFHTEAFCSVKRSKLPALTPDQAEEDPRGLDLGPITEMLPLSHPKASRTSSLPPPSDIRENLPV